LTSESHLCHGLIFADWASFIVRDGELSFLDGYGPKLWEMPVAGRSDVDVVRDSPGKALAPALMNKPSMISPPLSIARRRISP
jgi:hypothetical protein